jgi:hypothetical protein
VHHLGDAPPCIVMPSTVTVVAPSGYACHENFMSRVSITNNSCAPMIVQQIKLTAAVTNGA